MHICFLTTEYPGIRSGGIGSFIKALGTEFVNRGHKVTVLGIGAGLEAKDGPITLRFLPAARVRGWAWFENRRRLYRELEIMARRDALDIIEAPDWCGISAGIRASVPIVVRCHGSDTYFAHLLRRKCRPSVHLAETTALRGAASVAAVSAFTADTTIRLFKLKQPVRVIHNGIHLPTASPDSESERTDPRVVLFFGTIVRKKGVLDLSRMFRMLLGDDKSAKLYIAGRDSRDQETGDSSTWSLCRTILGESASPQVSYFGELPTHELHRLIKQASVCVFPSYAEAFPMAWLEAMGCGKPIVVYDIGWARELIDHMEDGILVAPGDVPGLVASVRTLLNRPTIATTMGHAARAKIERKFSIAATCNQTLTWYDTCLEGQ